MSDTDLPAGFQLLGAPSPLAPAPPAAPPADRSALPPGFVPLASNPQEPPDVLEGIGHGADRTLQGVHQAFLELKNAVAPSDKSAQDLKDYTDNLNSEESLYQKGRGPNAGIDWASLGGAAGITAPLMLLPGVGESALARAAVGAGQGAVAGAAEPTSTGSLIDRTKNAAVGGVAGGVAAPVMGAVGDKLVSALNAVPGRVSGAMANIGGENTAARVLQEVPEIASVPAAAQPDLIAEAQSQISATGQLDAPSLARKANLIANGLTPTTSMVTRDPAQWSIERNVQKLAQSQDPGLSATGQSLTRVYQGNDAALATKADQLAQPYGAATQEARGMTTMNALNELGKQSQKDVSNVYDAVRDARGEELASDARNLHTTLGDLEDSPAADPITTAVKRRLTKMGMMDADGNLTDKSLTVTQSEGLRQFVNQQPNAYGKSQVMKAIDQDTIQGLGEDAFAGPRAAAYQRFQMLNNPATQKALNNIGELSQGKTAQNFVKSQIISAPEQDVNSLLGTIGQITDDTQRNGALNAIRGGVMEHLQDAAVKSNGQFSGASLQKAMDAVGPNKLQAVFGPDVHAKLQSLAQAAKDATYEPAYASVNYSNTAPAMLSLVQKMRTIPFIGEWAAPEGLKEAAARGGYQSQLANALKAKAAPPPSGLSPAIQKRLTQLLAAPGAPVAAAGVNQLRNPGSQ
jgi:hypothetical protein